MSQTPDDLEARCRRQENLAVQLSHEIANLRRQREPFRVRDYELKSICGVQQLSSFVRPNKPALVIHNMGIGCSFCTVYADSINGVSMHLRSVITLVLVSPDPPDTVKEFARRRGWTFPALSILGTSLSHDVGLVCQSGSLLPGVLVIEIDGSELFVRAKYVFEPGDHFSPLWPLLWLSGVNASEWQPKSSC